MSVQPIETISRMDSSSSAKQISGIDNSAFIADRAGSNENRRQQDYRSSIASIEKSKATERITYTWKNINVWTGEPVPPGNKAKPPPDEESGLFTRCCKRKPPEPSKQLLKNVNGIVRPGELVALMGASGAGKTTLLNVMTFRNTEKLKVSGERAVNGVPVGPDSLTAVSAYVQLDDLFIGTLTVKEHLVFQALVRMHSHIPYKARMARVDEVISELGLFKCANTMIGIPGRAKGISGGEMKRLAFASEVLTDPALYFADEPTSGLDSYMAQNVVGVLKNMAKKGKTIVCTIHQPSSQVYAMFDRVLFMAEGRVAFMGNADKAMEFFNMVGYPCPSNFNPSDFFVQTLAILPGYEDASRKKVSLICDNFELGENGKEIKRMVVGGKVDVQSAEYLKEEAAAKSRSPYKASWYAQFRAVLWRSWKTNLKDPLFIKVKIFQTVSLSLIIGLVYFGQKLNQDGVQNISGALFLIITNMTFSNTFGVIDVFCLELPVFLREHFNGMYRTDVYFISKTLAELPFYIIFPALFIIINYFMIGLHPDAGTFFATIGIIILIANCGCSFGYLISCFAKSMSVAMALGPALLIPLMLFGGFFLNTGSIPVYFVWIKYISWFHYGNEALAITQWKDVKHIDCNREKSTCPPNGDVILKTFGFKRDNLGIDVVLLAVLVVGFRILAYLALLSKTFRQK